MVRRFVERLSAARGRIAAAPRALQANTRRLMTALL
jgi:hypothetical protein